MLNKVRLFDQIQSKASDSNCFERLDSCAALEFKPFSVLCFDSCSSPSVLDCGDVEFCTEGLFVLVLTAEETSVISSCSV